MDKQKFIDKFIAAFLILAVIKVIVLFGQLGRQSIGAVIGQVFLFLFIAFVLLLIITALTGGSGGASGNGGGSSAYLESSMFDKVRQTYEDLARKYLKEGNYKGAAQIYMNLLQDNYRGASTLADGELYNEAAFVYLKKLYNKEQAAQCYEKAKNYKKAIDLFRELNQNEKVGDLYLKINDRANAHHFYQMVIDDYIQNRQMVKASLIYRKKMDMPEKAQEHLLKGWRRDWDGYNCLNNYFANISDMNALQQAIRQQYKELPDIQKRTYLNLMKHEFKKDESLSVLTRNIAYEIVAEQVHKHPDVVSELKFFNPEDKNIMKDILRFKTKENQIIQNN